MQSTTTTKGWHRREAQQNPTSPLPRASRLLAQSPPGIGRKRPSLPGQPLGDPASGVPFGCRKCVPLTKAETDNTTKGARLTDEPSASSRAHEDRAPPGSRR